MISFNVNAQIQRTFFGLEIGVASKQQVKSKLKNLGKSICRNKADEMTVNNLELGDNKWAKVSFVFKDDKFVAIVLQSKKYPLAEKSDAYLKSKSIGAVLSSKYKDYNICDKSGLSVYQDEDTLSLFYIDENKAQVKYFILIYADGNLLSEMLSKMKSEL